MIRKTGFALIVLGLFFFGLTPIELPIVTIVSGVLVILFDNEIKL